MVDLLTVGLVFITEGMQFREVVENKLNAG